MILLASYKGTQAISDKVVHTMSGLLTLPENSGPGLLRPPGNFGFWGKKKAQICFVNAEFEKLTIRTITSQINL